MNRATCPKTAILGRAADRAAGTLYIGVDGPIAMAHALYVTAEQRRQGLARNLLRAAARWASEAGAARLVLAVESDNAPAVGLYRAMGMTPAAHYHYRER
jgi:GNAT superfamily N-acetyltransferase